jgi:hydrogenase expression/formation protein HypE
MQLSCPVPISEHSQVLLAHGGGGRLMNNLIEKVFLDAFRNPLLEARHDGAVMEVVGTRLAFTADSYVVHPLFFPGGDIGSMAVHGTLNDLAMCGAKPLFLSAAFILEEGLPIETLTRVVQSMKTAAGKAGVWIVTGDTKVVNKGKADNLFISMAGIGMVPNGLEVGPRKIQEGDVMILNGDLGRHGMAVMAVREGLTFETTLESDSADLSGLVVELLEAGIEIHCLRDLTRGGLASALNEISSSSGFSIQIEESTVPVCEEVRGACEILGLDPLYVANEGRLVAVVPEREVDRCLQIFRAHPLGKDACCIGKVSGGHPHLVTLKTSFGMSRILDMLSGEQLPRIC